MFVVYWFSPPCFWTIQQSWTDLTLEFSILNLMVDLIFLLTSTNFLMILTFFFLNHPGLVLSHCYYLNTCHIGDVWTFHTLYYVDIWHIGAIWTFVTFVLFSGVLDQLSQWYSSMPSSETIDMVLIDLLLAWLVLCSLSRRFLRPSHDSKSYWFWCSGTHVIHLREFR